MSADAMKLAQLGLLLLLMAGASMNAHADWLYTIFGLGNPSWEEEVLLHDGGKIIVEREVSRGGRHEIGQQPPIKEQSLTFTLPASNERVIWKSEFSKDVGLADFQPLLLDVSQGVAYVVTHPVGCLSYNKWGRPNPPYVIFKYQGKEWQRITLQELPAEIKTPNIIFGSPDNHAERLGAGLITTEMIQQVNSTLTQPEYRSILREGYAMDPRDCGEMVRVNDGWEGLGFFKNQPSYEACLKYCDRKDVSQQNCPCVILFKEKK